MRKAENRVTCPKQQGNDRTKSAPTNHNREASSLLNTLAWKKHIYEMFNTDNAKFSVKSIDTTGLLVYWSMCLWSIGQNVQYTTIEKFKNKNSKW